MKHLTLFLPLLFTIMVTGCNEPKEAPRHHYNWDVAVCNSIGCNHYDCDTYTQDGTTYKLFVSDTLTNQVTVTAGIAVIISKQ